MGYMGDESTIKYHEIENLGQLREFLKDLPDDTLLTQAGENAMCEVWKDEEGKINITFG